MAARREGGPDLANLLTLYRRALSERAHIPGDEVELEIRFNEVDLGIFTQVFNALVEGSALPNDGGVVLQSISSIMADTPAARRNRSNAPALKASLIRLSRFADGTRVGKPSYYRKAPLAAPFRMRLPDALPYLVAVSAETPLAHEFTSDRGAYIRAKLRTAFTLTGLPWRVDLTISKALTGADAAALHGIVERLFPRGGRLTPGTLLAALGLDDPENSEARVMYRYEIEIEHLAGAPGEVLAPGAVTDIAARVLGLSDPHALRRADYQAEVFYVAAFVLPPGGAALRRYQRELGLKELLPAAVTLSRASYAEIYPPTGCYLLDKTDGLRALATAHDGILRLLHMGGDLAEYLPVPGAAVTAGATIADGEWIGGSEPEGGGTFFIFDIIAVKGENLAGFGYDQRVERAAEAEEALRAYGLRAFFKPYVRLTASEPDALRVQFQAPELLERPYPTDGWILVMPAKSYVDTKTLKWKPAENTTIDFLARRAPLSARGHPPFVDAPGHELYFLFVGIAKDMFAALGLELAPGYDQLFPNGARARGLPYFPAQFAPSDAPLAYLYQHPRAAPPGPSGAGWAADIDGQVVELRCAEGCLAAGTLGLPTWRMVRLRAEHAQRLASGKYFGNNFKVAEQTWLNYVDVFPPEELWQGPGAAYFAAPKGALYRAQTAFTSSVKSSLIHAELRGADWVVDLGVGKGQDLGRYLTSGVGHLVGVDADRAALTELVKRKYSYAQGRGHRQAAGGLALYALHANLLERPPLETAAQIRGIPGFPPDGAAGVTCNLAVHYFAGRDADLQDFAQLASSLVRPGGRLLLTFLDGARVLEILAASSVGEGEAWSRHASGVLQYRIRREFAEPALTAAGQRISVLLPFSAGELVPEYLVNIPFLLQILDARGFTLRRQSPFSALGSASQPLSAADTEWISLYVALVLDKRAAPAAPAATD